MMNGWYGTWGWQGWLFMGLMMVALWGTVSAVVVLVVRSSCRYAKSTPGEPRSDDKAVPILDEPVAHDEIGADVHATRRDLMRTP